MYNKNEIKQIRSIPTSKEDEDFKTRELMENYFKNLLIKEREGKFLYKNSLSGELPILGLVHWEGSVVASGIIKSIEENDDDEYKYYFQFDLPTIKYFKEPINPDKFREIKLRKEDGGYFNSFTQGPMKFDMRCFDEVHELILSHYYPYNKSDFLEDAFLVKDDYDAMEHLLKKYKNLILQGPPGVGKTFLSKRLAYSILGYKYSNRVEMVQFHQSYSYEDFFMGYKPSEEGFELVEGPFYKFCKRAEKHPSKDYFFIIDEINRGDLSKIFGELFMLIEDDKRGEQYKIKLLYKDEYFYVPENVYIIGLMNTADRSIAMVDWALRRRFSFFDLKPGFNSEGFIKYQGEIENSSLDNVIEQIKSLNETIRGDDSLDEGFCIGHSYFCNLQQSEDIETDLRYIIDYKILPLIKEYWFDDPENDEIKNLRELSLRLNNDL